MLLGLYPSPSLNQSLGGREKQDLGSATKHGLRLNSAQSTADLTTAGRLLKYLHEHKVRVRPSRDAAGLP